MRYSWVLALGASSLLGCSVADNDDTGSGGAGGVGGGATGGAAGSPGGAGRAGSGGSSGSSGGSPAQAGTGGRAGAGAAAGVSGDGGRSGAGSAGRSGSAGAGGSSAGSTSSVGGAANGGSAGATSGGASGSSTTGGSGGAGGARTSAGCGKATTLETGNATIDVAGTSRNYILTIPDDYSPTTPYKLIFGWHWRGGQASDVATNGSVGLGNYYGLEDLADGSAIFVAPNGIDNGWANTNSRDINFLKAMLARFESELCIDLDRIFSAGFSYGGMMSFAIACEMGDVFRAIAPMSGALYSGCGNGTEPIALFGTHGTTDNVVPIGDGRAGLQEILERNNCGTETSPTTPSPCVTYEGCDEGYPVTWCEFQGGHSPQQWSSEPLWDFFSAF